jgi:SH3-like domain-containing protein
MAFLLVTSPAWAQTPEVPSSPVHHSTKTRHSTAGAVTAKSGSTKPAASKTAAHGTPVVSPRHGAMPRKAARGSAALKTPTFKDIQEKPAPKPAAKPAPKPVPAKPPVPPDVGTVTGLHLPRYASLKTDDVNMRSGPGSRYPVQWTYKRRELPVRIEREFDIWRLVEDMDGIKGWVHQATLTGRRTFVITGTDPHTMRADPSDSAAAVAVLKPGVVGRIKSCDANAAWCAVQVGDYRGWLARADFWGTDAGEAVAP